MVRDRAWGIWEELKLRRYVKSRKNAFAVPVRSSILHECRSDFAAQVFRWDSTVDGFLFLATMSSTSPDSEMIFDSEDAEIYYIAEDMK